MDFLKSLSKELASQCANAELSTGCNYRTQVQNNNKVHNQTGMTGAEASEPFKAL